MPQALGLVETKGLVGAIVAADAMAKAANVTIIGKEKVDPALITIKIIGETAAVKSAIEAGAAAAQRVGQLISTHIIPSPDVQLGILFPEILKENNEEPPAVEIPNPIAEKKILPGLKKLTKGLPVKQEKKLVKVEPQQKTDEVLLTKEQARLPITNTSLFDEVIEHQIRQAGTTLERLRAEALKDLQSEEITTEEDNKEETPLEHEGKYDYDNSSVSLEDLESFNVHQLRKLARGVEIFPIHGREISRANRETLLAYFKSLKK